MVILGLYVDLDFLERRYLNDRHPGGTGACHLE